MKCQPRSPWAAFIVLSAAAVASLFAAEPAAAQMDFEREPIQYSASQGDNPVTRLQSQIDAGKLELSFDAEHGYLPSVLEALKIPLSSQMLVFSKTSFQQRRIAPWSPRALYFNDNVYVGWVPEGDVIEVSSADPKLGAVFYTLDQSESRRPKFVRDQGNCLTCHASSRTGGVPGHLVRSVFPAPSGQPHYGAGTFRTNHSSPLKERWGGWYVSGTHGRQRHMGNVVSSKADAEALDVDAGANVTDLSKLTRTGRYLTPHSDLVALMVLEHQTDMHNRITFANFESRQALQYQAIMNRALERPENFQSESTQRRIASASEKLLEYLLFAEEAQLTDPVAGTSGFAKQFAKLGPRDGRGRSLREFDLNRRMFKYPCSYLIYSREFQALPSPVKNRVYRRLWEVLTQRDRSEKFAHLDAETRQAIYEILCDTHPDLCKSWQVSE